MRISVILSVLSVVVTPGLALAQDPTQCPEYRGMSQDERFMRCMIVEQFVLEPALFQAADDAMRVRENPHQRLSSGDSSQRRLRRSLRHVSIRSRARSSRMSR